MVLTKEQRKALWGVFLRTQPEMREGVTMLVDSYRQFRRAVKYGFDGVVMVPFAGMWLGIERDGYTHS